MKTRTLLTLAAGAAAFSLAGSAPAKLAPARGAPRGAAIDWSTKAVATPSGSFLRGNPAAKVKLVEYASFTCSHCAAFQAEAKGALVPLIRSGHVSLEVRNAIRDRFDMAASLLARCQGPANYFKVADGIFAAQADWLGRAAALAEPDPQASVDQVLLNSAKGVGLDRLAAPGLPPAKVAACLSSAPEQAKLTKMRSEAWEERHISGTPFFLLNGQPLANVFDWAGLEPRLRAALQ